LSARTGQAIGTLWFIVSIHWREHPAVHRPRAQQSVAQKSAQNVVPYQGLLQVLNPLSTVAAAARVNLFSDAALQPSLTLTAGPEKAKSMRLLAHLCASQKRRVAQVVCWRNRIR
jgi:hypothetical protein